jgi:hypothetical protein
MRKGPGLVQAQPLANVQKTQAAGTAVAPKQALQRPKPRKRGSGLPSPVLKLAWQRMHTYILELDIMGRTPGSALGRAAVYSACVWRSLGPDALAAVLVLLTLAALAVLEAVADSGLGVARRMVMV